MFYGQTPTRRSSHAWSHWSYHDQPNLDDAWWCQAAWAKGKRSWWWEWPPLSIKRTLPKVVNSPSSTNGCSSKKNFSKMYCGCLMNLCYSKSWFLSFSVSCLPCLMSNHSLFNIFMAIWNQPGGDTVLNLLEVKPTDLGCFGDFTGPERSIPEKQFSTAVFISGGHELSFLGD